MGLNLHNRITDFTLDWYGLCWFGKVGAHHWIPQPWPQYSVKPQDTGRKEGLKMTIDTAQLKFKSSIFTGSYLMSFSFRPQQGQHTKYPRHSRCVSLVYLSCDLPVLPEGTKDYQVKDIWASINQLVGPPLHRFLWNSGNSSFCHP